MPKTHHDSNEVCSIITIVNVCQIVLHSKLPKCIYQVLSRVLETGEHRNRTSVGERLRITFQTGGRAVLMLRNPYDAIASWWNHVQSRTPNYGPGLVKKICRVREHKTSQVC